ncbi:MAG: hypothetical protein MZV70_60945 [Desulfobacterales bacterium]|nr:hypothetical protein [Desulfobacterales bacterium]
MDDDEGLLLSIKATLISAGLPEPALVSDSRRVIELLRIAPLPARAAGPDDAPPGRHGGAAAASRRNSRRWTASSSAPWTTCPPPCRP